MGYESFMYKATQKNNINDLNICENDKNILRELSKKVVSIAAKPEQEQKRKLWYDHIELKETRPVIFCYPENGWNEIITKKDIKCEGDSAHVWEMMLRKEIFWGEIMGDDYVVEPYFNLNHCYTEGDWGMHEVKVSKGKNGAFKWEPPLIDFGDVDKLHFPSLKFDREKSERLFLLANEIFGGILKVRSKGKLWHSLGMTHTLSELRGLDTMMFDFYDHPDEIHRIMGMLRDYNLYKIDYAEKNGLLTVNNDELYGGGGVFGYTRELPVRGFDRNHVRPIDMWGWFESQETVGVSPAMFEEFVFRYQMPVMEKFGLISYGCCEPLNNRWNIIKKIPRLRRVSVSPWANIADMAEKLGSNYIYCLKPTPADLAVPEVDEEYIRRKLREALKLTRDCRVEVIMKDNHTIGKNPQNLITWSRIAKEEAENI